MKLIIDLRNSLTANEDRWLWYHVLIKNCEIILSDPVAYQRAWLSFENEE